DDPDSDIHPKWAEILPSLDVWLKVEKEEIHHVAHLIPTLDWSPDDGIGVRLQLSPRDSQDLLESFSKAKKTRPPLNCPYPGCENKAAPVFGMMCKEHKDVPEKDRQRMFAERRAAVQAT
ncbi:MAG: hypothetical protein ABIP48_23970, partial [Planctomycetota bacterium]